MMIAKGTILEQDIATVMTPIAQIFALSGPGEQTETTEFDAFDNPSRGIPMRPTGRAAAGEWQFSVFLDLQLASHLALLAKIKVPAVHDWNLEFSDGEIWPIEGIITGPAVTVALNDGVKCDFGIVNAEAIDYPTA